MKHGIEFNSHLVNPDFSKKFEDRSIYQSPFGPVETVDISPITHTHQTPVLFAPGWQETIKMERECLYELYDSGRRVVSLTHPMAVYKRDTNDGFPAIEARKAETLLGFLDAKDIHQIDAMAHSEGAINLAIAAMMQPERFRSLVLVTPAGLIGDDNLLRLSIGFGRHVVRTGQINKLLKGRLKGQIYHQKLPLLKKMSIVLEEGLAMTSFNLHPLLLDLRKKGVRIAVLAGEKDTAFPIDRLKNHLSKSAPEDEHFGFDMFATKPGGHEIYTNTHEIMKQVLGIFDNLERN